MTRSRWIRVGFGCALAFAGAAAVPSCSLGGGQGSVTGNLDVVDCWSGPFNLQPDFFAAVPYRQELLIRIQNGGDYENFSDGVSILVDDVNQVRGGMLGKAIPVALQPEVTPPGVPIAVVPDPAIVHFSLYLQRSCRLETPALYVTREVTLNQDGSCGAGADSGAQTLACNPDAGPDGGADAGAPAALPTAKSTITFASLFDGDPDEADAQKRLTDATFDVYLADPREVCPGGVGAPPRCRGHLTGSFRFYFQRGRPAQPFP